MSVGSSNVASSQDEESKGTDICRCAGSNPMDSTDEPSEMEIHILPADIEDTTQPLSPIYGSGEISSVLCQIKGVCILKT